MKIVSHSVSSLKDVALILFDGLPKDHLGQLFLASGIEQAREMYWRDYTHVKARDWTQ